MQKRVCGHFLDNQPIEKALTPNKCGDCGLYSPIRTRFFFQKLKQICLIFISFPISFISFSYRALTCWSSVAVALPCMYYIREGAKSEDFIWTLSKNSYYPSICYTYSFSIFSNTVSTLESSTAPVETFLSLGMGWFLSFNTVFSQ